MSKNLPPLILSLIVLFIGSRLSPNFLDAAYLRDSASLLAEIGIIAIAMNYVIAAGQIDLSVGANMILTSCVTAKLLQFGMPAPLAILSGVLFATSLGSQLRLLQFLEGRPRPYLVRTRSKSLQTWSASTPPRLLGSPFLCGFSSSSRGSSSSSLTEPSSVLGSSPLVPINGRPITLACLFRV